MATHFAIIIASSRRGQDVYSNFNDHPVRRGSERVKTRLNSMLSCVRLHGVGRCRLSFSLGPMPQEHSIYKYKPQDQNHPACSDPSEHRFRTSSKGPPGSHLQMRCHDPSSPNPIAFDLVGCRRGTEQRHEQGCVENTGEGESPPVVHLVPVTGLHADSVASHGQHDRH